MLCTREASAGPCLLLGTLSLQSKLRSGQPLGALERDEREERRERKRGRKDIFSDEFVARSK
jgi:hypothetical protein